MTQAQAAFARDDRDGGLALLMRGAEAGSVEAQLALGRTHDEGSAGIRNELLAYVWYAIAASSGDDGAARARDRVAAELQGTQRELAETLMRTHLKRIARQ